MKRIRTIGLLLLLLLAKPGSAKCLTGTELWERVEYLRQSARTPEAQLEELQGLQQQAIACGTTADSSYASLLQRLGVLYFLKQDLPRAIRYAEAAVQAGRLRNPSTNPAHLAKSYYNLAIFYKTQNRFAPSQAAFDSCIAYARPYAANRRFAALSQLNLSNLFFRKGDYGLSVLHAEKGALLSRELADPLLEASCLREKAQALSEINEPQAATAAIRSSVAIYQEAFQLREPDFATLADLANAYTIFAKTLIHAKKPLPAIDYYQKALELFRKTGHQQGCFTSLNNIGYTYTEELADYPQGKTWYRKALRYAGSNDDTLLYYTNISAIFNKEKQYDSSLRYLQYALLALPLGFRNPDPAADPDAGQLAQSSGKVMALNLVAGKGDLWLDKYRSTRHGPYLQQALRTYYLADKVVDAMRFEQQASESKLFWRQNTCRLYENAIEVCYLLQRPAEAFYFFEKGRSALLYDQLREQEWLVKKNAAALERQAQLQTELVKGKRELAALPGNGRRRDELVNQVFNSEQALSRLMEDLKKRAPYYFNNFLDSSFVTLPQLQQHLRRHRQGMVELFEGDSAVYVLVLLPDALRFKKIGKQEYDRQVADYISYISNEPLLNRKFNTFVQVAHRLHQLIFGPTPLPAGRLVVAPDGRYFPFEALVSRQSGDSVTWLLNDHAVSYTYSARYLLLQEASAAPRRAASFMGIAPVRFPPGWNLAPLDASDHSLDRIREHFQKPAVFLFEQATRANFLEGFYRHRVIQLYTHATDSGQTGEPAIYLADSVLYLSDLVTGRRPVTDLVILSACETGSGRVYRGEGVFSFNRGLAAVGIPASVTNLWSVNNQTTYRLTELFYQYLDKGLPSDEALQRAKLEFLRTASRTEQLPFYWASMILAGKTDPIAFTRPFPWKAGALGAGMALLAAGVFWKWKRRSRR
ncbi:CHAT domain-containing protein [Paraflavisolibacter sp. H34]|uniref:CHAT domain-containing protein n=1 Tax=Huijunlia imazamoxiresistens TaxID=3127457 RepID=UPI003017DD3A